MRTEKGSSSSMTTSRQEKDEMLNQMEEDERLLDESEGEEKQNNTDQKEKAADAVRASSVGTLTKNFMKNVQVGSSRARLPPTTLQSPPQAGGPPPLAQSKVAGCRANMRWLKLRSKTGCPQSRYQA